jgi:hypothetical protein
MHSSWICSSFVDIGGSWGRIDGSFWCQEDGGCDVRSLLLTKDETGH